MRNRYRRIINDTPGGSWPLRVSMKVLLLVLSLSGLKGLSEIVTFVDAKEDVRKHLLNGVADAIILGYDIAVIHSRPDEWLRSDGELDSRVKRTLNLLDYRFLTFLKGESMIEGYSIGYVYPPKFGSRGYVPFRPSRPAGRDSYDGRYLPTFLKGDDLMRLVFIKQKKYLLKERVVEARGGIEIHADAKAMGSDAFMNKYGIKKIFENRVYISKEDAAFKVDFKAPDLPPTKAMKINAGNQSLSEGAVSRLQSVNRLIQLSDAEVSELVLLSYMFDERYTVENYEEFAIQNSDFITFLPEGNPSTEFGKSLFKVLKDKNSLMRSPDER